MHINGSVLLRLWLPFFLTACTAEPAASSTTTWQEICGRDDALSNERHPLYRGKVPLTWIKIEPVATSLIDTTLSICEWVIYDGEEKIKVFVHNFPSDSVEQRVPPMAQIARWKNQFDYLEPAITTVTELSHGGFAGYFLEASGQYHDKPQSILAWSMQLAPIHYRSLERETGPQRLQKRADYTIKVLGPPASIEKNRKAIIAFANSFELIEEIPPHW